MVQTYTLRIKNGTRHVKQYRIWLWWKKYTCIKRANGRVYYEKKECSRREKNHMQRFSRRKGLTFEAVPTQYTRSNSYRSQFFACHPSATGKYRCAYCGKKKPKDKITIDIFSRFIVWKNIRPCAKEPHCLEFTVRMI